MNDSVLTSVKKMLGIDENYTHFDLDIIIHINSTFLVLRQMGIGPKALFSIEDATATWSDFDPDQKYPSIKPYVYLRVRRLFDPPASSSVMEAINKEIEECEFRLMHEAEFGEVGD